MNTSEQIDALASALSLAQGKMEAAKMNAVNPFLKNKYADLGAIIDAVKPHLAANGLSFIQLPTAPSELFPGVGLVTRLLHSSGQWVEEAFYMPIPEGKGINSAQQYGVALTYARRYALASLFGIVADADTDGSTEKPAVQAKKEPTLAAAPTDQAPQKQPTTGKSGERVTHHAPTVAMLNKLHAIGVQKFGPEWDDARHQLIGKLTEGRTQSSKDLTYEEVVKLAEMMKSFSDYVDGDAPLFDEDGSEEN